MRDVAIGEYLKVHSMSSCRGLALRTDHGRHEEYRDMSRLH